MMDNAEVRVSNFYNEVGWKTDGEITEDANRWEDLREHARDYVSKCRRRVLRHIPDYGMNILDMASGPIQYHEYLEYSKKFEKRYCVDLSSDALALAKRKIGNHGVFLHGSFFNIPLQENFFDCSVSLHTIYHIDKNKQEEAVRKLITVTKPGKPIIIVYSNPDAFESSLVRLLKKIKNVVKKPRKKSKLEKDLRLYSHRHPVEWWNRFSDLASVQILPWRSFSSDTQKRLIPNNKMGGKMLNVLFNLEERFPGFFAKHFQYSIMLLTKRINLQGEIN